MDILSKSIKATFQSSTTASYMPSNPVNMKELETDELANLSQRDILYLILKNGRDMQERISALENEILQVKNVLLKAQINGSNAIGSSFSSVESHVNKHSSIPTKNNDNLNLLVDFCGSFVNEEVTTETLNASSDEHTKTKPYSCNICAKTFTSNNDLKRHQRVHNGEKPYKCEVCDKGFTQKGNLTKHSRFHSGEKPYKCDVCGKGFAQKDNLKSHLRSHSGEKPYKCDICDMAFSHRGSLKSHSLSHTGEKPYSCNICDKSFVSINGLKYHEGIHSGEKPYKCDVCGKGFTQSSRLKKHFLLHTNDESPNAQ